MWNKHHPVDRPSKVMSATRKIHEVVAVPPGYTIHPKTKIQAWAARHGHTLALCAFMNLVTWGLIITDIFTGSR